MRVAIELSIVTRSMVRLELLKLDNSALGGPGHGVVAFHSVSVHSSSAVAAANKLQALLRGSCQDHLEVLKADLVRGWLVLQSVATEEHGVQGPSGDAGELSGGNRVVLRGRIKRRKSQSQVIEFEML